MNHTIKPGIATGKEVQKIHQFAKEKGFAFPAINVTGSNTINTVLETAAELNSPVIIQFSNGGAHFNAGKGLSNENQKAAIAGATFFGATTSKEEEVFLKALTDYDKLILDSVAKELSDDLFHDI